MVPALKRLAVPVLGRDPKGTVAADVDESVQLPFEVSREQHRDVRDPADVVVAGVRDSRLLRDQLPASREYVLELDVEDGRVRVPARRERHVPVERRLDGLRVDAELDRSRAHRVSAGTALTPRLRHRMISPHEGGTVSPRSRSSSRAASTPGRCSSTSSRPGTRTRSSRTASGCIRRSCRGSSPSGTGRSPATSPIAPRARGARSSRSTPRPSAAGSAPGCSTPRSRCA